MRHSKCTKINTWKNYDQWKNNLTYCYKIVQYRISCSWTISKPYYLLSSYIHGELACVKLTDVEFLVSHPLALCSWHSSQICLKLVQEFRPWFKNFEAEGYMAFVSRGQVGYVVSNLLLSLFFIWTVLKGSMNLVFNFLNLNILDFLFFSSSFFLSQEDRTRKGPRLRLRSSALQSRGRPGPATPTIRTTGPGSGETAASATRATASSSPCAGPRAGSSPAAAAACCSAAASARAPTSPSTPTTASRRGSSTGPSSTTQVRPISALWTGTYCTNTVRCVLR